jgi:malonate-semialdehyde dehydrogenase (acetylating)/methylmalonate-semialdehyde dehydrogenase
MSLKPEVKSHYGKLKLLINGMWVNAKTQNYSTVTNPATGKEIAQLPFATQSEIDDACNAAQEAFLKWRYLPVRDRAKYLWNVRDSFERRFDELCRVLSQDHGRTYEEAVGSVRRCIENIESACSLIYTDALGKHVKQLATGIDQYIVREPRGPFLIISPGNIPMHAISSFLPYCLACGCTAIVSPSRQAPIASEWFIKAAQEAGFPSGVINLLHGGREINKAILENPAIKGVGFIGSSKAGRELFIQASNLGKISSINGNGKNHVVIMEDCNDLDTASEWLLRGCFGMTGQRCLGTDQVVVMGDAKKYREVKGKFVEAAKKMKLGYGLDETVTLGPLTTEGGRDKVLNWIELGLKEGAKIVLDGRSPKLDTPYDRGYFWGPTILENVTPDMQISHVEAFGPVANLLRSSNLDEVINWINSTLGGHSAAIFTASAKTARHFETNVDVGNVAINVAVAQPYAIFPMSSRRDAFYGMSKSRADSINLFLDHKVIISRWV